MKKQQVRGVAQHGFMESEAFAPENQFRFRVHPLPKRDWAQAALIEAREQYQSAYGVSDAQMETLTWTIELSD